MCCWIISPFSDFCCFRRMSYCILIIYLVHWLSAGVLRVLYIGRAIISSLLYYCSQVGQRTGRTILSSAWQMLALLTQDRPCGTTRCVVSIQALYLLQQRSLCIVRTIYRPSDTLLFSFPELTTWISVSLRSSHQVRDSQIYKVFVALLTDVS